VISEKKIYILQTDFEGKKSCKEIYGFACLGKKSYHQRFGRNKFLTQTKSPIPLLPPSKVKWLARWQWNIKQTATQLFS